MPSDGVVGPCNPPTVFGKPPGADISADRQIATPESTVTAWTRRTRGRATRELPETHRT